MANSVDNKIKSKQRTSIGKSTKMSEEEWQKVCQGK